MFANLKAKEKLRLDNRGSREEYERKGRRTTSEAIKCRNTYRFARPVLVGEDREKGDTFTRETEK